MFFTVFLQQSLNPPQISSGHHLHSIRQYSRVSANIPLAINSSEITWVEHSQDLCLAVGSHLELKRWLAVLQRQCERLAIYLILERQHGEPPSFSFCLSSKTTILDSKSIKYSNSKATIKVSRLPYCRNNQDCLINNQFTMD